MAFMAINSSCSVKVNEFLTVKVLSIPAIVTEQENSVAASILKVPITTATDDVHKYFFHCFSKKIRPDVSCESSARQRIHLEHQVLFSSKDKSKKLKCRLLQFLFGALRVKTLTQVRGDSD